MRTHLWLNAVGGLTSVIVLAGDASLVRAPAAAALTDGASIVKLEPLD